MAIEVSDWVDAGNREYVNVVADSAQLGNYKSLCVRRTDRGWSFTVNGKLRGFRETKARAQSDAIKFAKAN
jgi:hypothetical protein